MASRYTWISKACEQFIRTLVEHDMAENTDVFTILADTARAKGYELHAEQRGIHGTYIHFVRTTD